MNKNLRKEIKQMSEKLLKVMASEQVALDDMIETLSVINIQPIRWPKVQQQITRYLDTFKVERIKWESALKTAEIERDRRKRAYHDISMAKCHTFKPFEGLTI